MFYFNAKYLPALNLFAAKNDIRYYLCGIIVTPHPEKGVLLRATDGHTLMAVHDEEGFCKGRHIIVNTPDLIKYSKSPKRERGERWVTWNGRHTGRLMIKRRLNGDEIPHRAKDGEEVWASVSPKKSPNDAVFIDGKIPDIDNVIPKKGLQGGFSDFVNPTYIGRIGKALELLGDHAPSVSAFTEKEGKMGVILFKAASDRFDNVLFLVMPMAADASGSSVSRFLEAGKSGS